MLLVFILTGILADAQAPRKKKSEYRVDVNVRMVALDVSVLNVLGEPVIGLTQADFLILDEGRFREITLFQKADLPISIGIVIDTSGSMRNKLDFVNHSILSFLAASNPENEFFIVDFAHDKPELVCDFTRDPDEIRDTINEKMLTGGGTPLWDSVYLALEHLQNGRYDRKALLIISDGEDKDSFYRAADISRQVRTMEFQLYFIGLQDRTDGSLFDLGSSAREEARAEIQQLATDSGGRGYFPEDLDQLDQIATKLASELRLQYRLGFNPPGTLPKQVFRKLQVQIANKSNYQVRTRRGYFILDKN